MTFNTTSLVWASVWGIFGLAYFVYGKKQAAVMPLACGLALMVFPYFVANLYVLVGVGLVLLVLPYFLRF